MKLAVKRLLEGKTPRERSGIIWHTQGSGKSLTMVFVIRKLRMCDDLKDYKVCLINDRTDLEKQLSKMWATLLGLSAVGLHENFFDLGGHSLLAVQLLSLVRQTFDIDLSLKVVYSGEFTVAELAKAIELRQIEGAGAAQYAGILKELEALSDAEVRALLAAEQNGTSGGKPQK